MINTKMTMIRKRGESLRQVERFFLCVRAIMSIHIRFFIILCFDNINIDVLSKIHKMLNHTGTRFVQVDDNQDLGRFCGLHENLHGGSLFFLSKMISLQPTNEGRVGGVDNIVSCHWTIWNMGSIKQIQYIRDELTAQIFYSKLEQVCRI